MKTLQLNKNLVAQLENTAMLFNAAAGFKGKHIAVVIGTYQAYVDVAERVTTVITDCGEAYISEDMNCYVLTELNSDEDVADAIIQVTTMLIKFNLGK